MPSLLWPGGQAGAHACAAVTSTNLTRKLASSVVQC